MDKPHAYHTRVDWALFRVFDITGDHKYRKAAEKNVRWILAHTKDNGWIDHMGFVATKMPLTHTIAYTLRGLLESSRYFEDETREQILNIVVTASDNIIHLYGLGESKGIRSLPMHVPATLDEEWRSNDYYSCLTGNAQLAIIWMKLYKLLDDRKYLKAAFEHIDKLKKTQSLNCRNLGIRGGIAGSYPIWGKYAIFGYPNWAAKFFADSIMLKQEIIRTTVPIEEKKRVYFLTRSYLPSITGGTLIRSAQVEHFTKHGFEVKVATPNYKHLTYQLEGNTIKIPFYYSSGMLLNLERFGIFEDYLDLWIMKAYKILLRRVKRDDILFATSGGGLGMVKLGYLLKETIGCKLIINFHDPINYSIVNGMKVDSRFHIGRERQVKKYLSNADLIITTSMVYQKALRRKYPNWDSRIINNYFGYIQKVNVNNRKPQDDNLRIAYGGAFSKQQSPEILANLTRGDNSCEAVFIGGYHKYQPIRRYLNEPNVKFYDTMRHEDYIEYITNNIDVGFASLSNDYLGACVPSKIYEYINLGLPILAALPQGDAMDIINDNQYGIACKYDDIDGLKAGLRKMKDRDTLARFQQNMLRDRDDWSMDRNIKKVITCMKNM